MSIIDTCRDFYLSSVAPMITRCFPEYEHRIAAGVAGEGSDCFGYDDEISKDHDFGIGVCLWLTDEDYDEIGEELGEAYRGLIEMFVADGGTAVGTSRQDTRRGAIRISDYYSSLLRVRLDTDTPSMTDNQWYFADEQGLAAAVNGEVFRDDLGKFSRIRDMLLAYYPDKIMKMKLVNALHGYAGSWQANYPRCMARHDYVAAHHCISTGIESAMKIVFLLERRYTPYYKWSYRALNDLGRESGREEIREIARLIGEAAVIPVQQSAWEHYTYDPTVINTEDELVRTGEKIASLISGMLTRQGLCSSTETFLEAQCREIAESIKQ